MSQKDVLQFTTILCDLMNSEMSLKSSLEMMSRMDSLKKNCRDASEEIKMYLAEGSKFSLALRKCRSIVFDDVFIAFICSAEKSGGLEKTISFLKSREESKNSRFGKMISMSVYPMFVIVLSFFGGLVLSFFATTLVNDISGNFDLVSYKKNVFMGCVEANVFLFVAIFGLVQLIRKMLSKNQSLDVFKIFDFMLDSGIDFYSSLETALLLTDKNPALKNQIIKTMDDISNGKKISESLSNFGKEYQLFGEVAQESGNMKKVFKQICCSLEKKISGIEKICMELLNPAIMLVAGVYIIILLKKIAMPVLFNFGL